MRPRDLGGWASLVCRCAAVVCAGAGLAARHGVEVGLTTSAVGLLVVPLAWRRKASGVSNALCTQSADLLDDGGRHLPGELSVTPTELVWVPSDHSRRRGATELRAPLAGPAEVVLQRGSALMDLVIQAQPSGAEAFRLLTHRSRRLRRVLDAASGRPPRGPLPRR